MASLAMLIQKASWPVSRVLWQGTPKPVGIRMTTAAIRLRALGLDLDRVEVIDGNKHGQQREPDPKTAADQLFLHRQ